MANNDPNMDRRLPCKHGWYKVVEPVDTPPRCYRVELVSGPDDGQKVYRDRGWVTRDRIRFDNEEATE